MRHTHSGRVSLSKKCRISSPEIPASSSNLAETCNLVKEISVTSLDSANRDFFSTYPVINKKAPTPPIQPTKICLGKNSLKLPNFKAPRAKKVSPISIEDKAKATIVVATISLSSEIEAEIIPTITWKKG